MGFPVMLATRVSLGGNASPHRGLREGRGRHRAGSARRESVPLFPHHRIPGNKGAGRSGQAEPWHCPGAGCQRALLAGALWGALGRGGLLMLNIGLLGCPQHAAGTQYPPALGATSLTSR